MTDKSYEDELGDALETLLSEGANELDALAAGLNRLAIKAPDGQPWSPTSLSQEFQRLGQ